MTRRLARTLVSVLRSAWLVFGALLVCAVLLEVVPQAAARLGSLGRSVEKPGSGTKLRWAEQSPVEMGWRPWVYFRARAHSEQNFNVDERGLRRTWNAIPETAAAVRIYMFGSSTLWGSYQRDDFTVPSLVAKQLSADSSTPVFVSNYAEKAYVTTQSLLALMFELRNGNTPDIAVFYDGGTDIQSAYLGEAAGATLGEPFRSHDHDGFLWGFTLRAFRHSYFLELVRTRVGGWDFSLPDTLRPPEWSEDLERVADEVVEIYVRNAQMSRFLGARYGFDVVRFWQPVIWTKSDPTAGEASIRRRLVDRYPTLHRFYEYVNARIAAHPQLRADPHFHDISDTMDGADDIVYLDASHTTEAGNERVARRIASQLRETIAAR